MCGRFSLTVDMGELARRFDLEGNWSKLQPNYNLAPTQDVLTVIDEGENRRGGFMRWGLIPHWAKTPSISSRMINARAETLAQKPAFYRAFTRRRRLIPESPRNPGQFWRTCTSRGITGRPIPLFYDIQEGKWDN